MFFGLFMVFAPALTRRGFGLIIYASAEYVESFGADAVTYISLAHAVLGAVMFGWGVVLFMLVRGPFARGEREGWYIIAISMLAWFIPDMAYSLWAGFWQNAILNLVFAVLFAVPLAATYPVFFASRRE